ncbi:MAG: hypothetical protein JSU94_07345, partial [Phycisphaerales bacterium]
DSETVSIIVENVNRPPVLETIGAKSVDENKLLTFTVNASDPDPDTIQYSATGLPSGATLTGQNFNWTPTHSQADRTYSVTFVASDGHLQDSETINITVSSLDTSPPVLINRSPAPDSIQAPLNTLTILHLVDPGKGVDADTVTIKLDGNLVYEGDTPTYTSLWGDCRRTGDKADYTFAFQSRQMFDFDQTVTVAVSAADLEGNVMPESSYSFKTEMRSFGRNMEVAWDLPDPGKGAPATVVDGGGYIWAVWHAGPGGDRDIYISALAPGAGSFSSHVQIDSDAADQCYPAIAADAADNIYVVWQDHRRGNWDIYLSTSADGASWSAPVRISDSNDNQTNPVIAVDSRTPNRVHVAWQDDGAGNRDIYVAASSDGFATKTITRITSDGADQIAPAIAVDSANTIYVVWTDFRGGSGDIYGAASNTGPWTNTPIAIGSADQLNPAIATEDAGPILHLLWVDDSSGSRDVYYASSSGLPDSPPAPRNIIDDTSGADQATPALAAVGVSGSNLRVFSCWQDSRNVTTTGGDTDLYFAEIGSGSPINVLVGDDRTNADQSAPALGVDSHGYPYIVWADTRDPNEMICYAGSTFVENEAVESTVVTASSGGTVGIEPESITTVEDVSLVVPPGAFPYDLTVTIGRIQNPQAFSMPCLNEYDFGPSGIVFSAPVTVTIPYEIVDGSSLASPYWYDSFTGALSQQGITDVETIVISPTLHALRFKTTHFTPYYVLSGSSTGGGGGGGGGCAVSAVGQGDVVSFFIPYVGLAVAMALLRLKDTRVRRMRHSSRR